MTATSLLGGDKVLKCRPRTAHDWHSLISRGVPVRSAEALKHSLAISDLALAGLLGISEKTLTRARKANASLDSTASDRLYRAARVAALAREVLETDESAVAWLKRPQLGLGNVAPLDLLTTSAGATEIEQLLLRIEHGVYS